MSNTIEAATARPLVDPHRDGGFDPQPNVPRPSHAESARTLIHGAGRATLSTVAVDPAGYPFGSLVTYVADDNGTPWILISTMAEHTRNAARDPRSSLLVAEDAPAGTDPLALARVSLVGNLVRSEPTDSFRARFLARHPGAKFYVDFPDFQWWRLEVTAVRYVGGFGRMSWVAADEFVGARPDPIAENAAGIVHHMNEDHVEAQAVLIRHFLKRPDILSAQMTSVDRFGCDFDTRSETASVPLRLPFPSPVETTTEVRAVLVAMLNEARLQGELG